MEMYLQVVTDPGVPVTSTSNTSPRVLGEHAKMTLTVFVSNIAIPTSPRGALATDQMSSNYCAWLLSRILHGQLLHTVACGRAGPVYSVLEQSGPLQYRYRAFEANAIQRGYDSTTACRRPQDNGTRTEPGCLPYACNIDRCTWRLSEASASATRGCHTLKERCKVEPGLREQRKCVDRDARKRDQEAAVQL